MTAAEQWADALGTWAIPDRILAQASSSPWIHPPRLFRSSSADPANTPSMRAASRFLGAGGSLLDVGCGGGRSCLPLGGLLRNVIGVDEQSAMLAQFTEAAARRGITSATVQGTWPDIAPEVADVDVVTCHHVVYNVAAIGDFVAALDSHARVGVVVELTNLHPQSPLNELWQHFWKLPRPSEPTADLFIEVVRELGRVPVVRTARRPRRPAPLDRDELVAFVRQRLCLTSGHDPEIDNLLGKAPLLSPDAIVSVSWATA
jgi:SAM-dependent methyltransferase